MNLSSLALSPQWPSAMYRDRIEFELGTLRFLGILNDLTLYPHLLIGHVFSRLDKFSKVFVMLWRFILVFTCAALIQLAWEDTEVLV